MKFPRMEGDTGNSFSIRSKFYLDLDKNDLPSHLITIFLLGISDTLLVLWKAQNKARRKDLTAGGGKKATKNSSHTSFIAFVKVNVCWREGDSYKSRFK